MMTASARLAQQLLRLLSVTNLVMALMAWEASAYLCSIFIAFLYEKCQFYNWTIVSIPLGQ